MLTILYELTIWTYVFGLIIDSCMGFGLGTKKYLYLVLYHDDLIVIMLCRVSPGQTLHSGASLICVRHGEREVLGSIPGRDIPKS